MGYQLAKDPLTGQILLIPTSSPSGGGGGGAGEVPPPGMWPPPPQSPLGPYDPAAVAAAGPYGPMGLPPPPRHMPPHLAAQYHHHHHHMLMQQQMYMQHAAAAAMASSRDFLRPPHPHHLKHPFPPASAGASTSRPLPPPPAAAGGPKPEPETITVSSSDDDEEEAAKKRQQQQQAKREQENVAEDQQPPPRPRAPPPDAASTVDRKPEIEPAMAAATEVHSHDNQVPEERPTCPGGGIKAELASPVEADLPPRPARDTHEEEPLATATTSCKMEREDAGEEAAPTISSAATPSADNVVEPSRIKSEPEAEAATRSSERLDTEASEEDTKPDVQSLQATDIHRDCAEALLSLASKPVDSPPPRHEDEIEEVVDIDAGLNLIVEGMERKESESGVEATGMDFLYRATRIDIRTYGFHLKDIDWTRMDLSLLQTVTALEYRQRVADYVDPLSVLRAKYDLHRYSSAEAEKTCRDYISEKNRQLCKEASVLLADTSGVGAVGGGVGGVGAVSGEGIAPGLANGAVGYVVPEEDEYRGIKSLAAAVKKIKNMEIMSQLEVDLRAQLVQIQSLYRERHRELARLKASPKKSLARSKRGPGRPKKRRLKSSNSKTKMGRPRKDQSATKSLPSIQEEKEEEDEGDDEEEEEEAEEPEVEAADEEEEDVDVDDLSPPVLEPCAPPKPAAELQQQQPPQPFANLTSAFGRPSSASTSTANSSGLLLKPPKLTASLSPPGASKQATDLSTISARFMKGKSNPFANLMKLASTPGSKPSSKHEDEDDDEEEEEEEEADDDEVEEEDGEDEKADDNEDKKESSAEEDIPDLSHDAVNAKDPEVGARPGAETPSSKKRKSDKPKKHMGATETIVPKQSKNLFMMNCVNLQRGFKSTSAEAARAAAAMRQQQQQQQQTSASTSTAIGADAYDFNEEDDDADLAPAATTPTRRPSGGIKQARVFGASFGSSGGASSPNGKAEKPKASKKTASSATETTPPSLPSWKASPSPTKPTAAASASPSRRLSAGEKKKPEQAKKTPSGSKQVKIKCGKW